MKILQQKLFTVIVPRSIKLIFINNKELIPNKVAFFLDSLLGIPYIVLWFNICNKELLALRNNFRVTQKFLIAKFDCIILNRCMYFETCPCARRQDSSYSCSTKLCTVPYRSTHQLLYTNYLGHGMFDSTTLLNLSKNNKNLTFCAWKN